ncbi:glycosyltransferase [Inquilinus limosus]|uniref:glycosyltransferase n=1 Tax=Inquilinus limosus TaxID=171674 RepID=UPI0004165B0A|nr:glycosyltransferase [Inquilinus limosus]
MELSQARDENKAGSVPRFSVVICTDGRADALRNTLDCLRYIDYPSFEVCVVHGPTQDGTDVVLGGYRGAIKVAANPERNLSISRNIGIAMASGDIVAFIDDDGLAEPEWLRDLEVAFRDAPVGGAGGVVYDHTGASPQYLYSSADRLARADWARATPADDYNFPLSYNFPYVQGTNSAFRRSVLLELGGFDEEYEFYLDETDLCCRLVDAGWKVAQLPAALVHHKFLPSAIRNEHRVTRHRFAVIKNKIYFSLINNHGHHSVDRAVRDASAFIDEHARDIAWHIERGTLSEEDLKSFHRDCERAWTVGLSRGLSGQRRLLRHETLSRYAAGYLEFPRPNPEGGRRTYCFLSQEYPPGRTGGIGRYVHQAARSIAAFGHHVHVLTRGEGHDRVDFENGVWVHRLLARPEQAQALPAGLDVPAPVWVASSTMTQAVAAIDEKRPVTAIVAPTWDCESIGPLTDGRLPVCTSLHTMLRSWLDSHREFADDATYMREFGTPMLALERHVLQHSDRILANSEAIVRQIQESYGLTFEPDRLSLVPHGLEDWSDLPAECPPDLAPGSLRMLFVGRLEARKGIDVLFDVARSLLPKYPHLHLDVVGNDSIQGPNGTTWRASFEADFSIDQIRDRVVFHGEVNDERLRGFYRSCDLLVTPSRFESFGLMLIEGMMFGKPVIGCRAGGMVEVVEDGVSGLLAEPGDRTSLAECVERLVTDKTLRERLGTAARARYENLFTAERMARGIIDCLDRAAIAHTRRPARETGPAAMART